MQGWTKWLWDSGSAVFSSSKVSWDKIGLCKAYRQPLLTTLYKSMGLLGRSAIVDYPLQVCGPAGEICHRWLPSTSLWACWGDLPVWVGQWLTHGPAVSRGATRSWVVSEDWDKLVWFHHISPSSLLELVFRAVAVFHLTERKPWIRTGASLHCCHHIGDTAQIQGWGQTWALQTSIGYKKRQSWVSICLPQEAQVSSAHMLNTLFLREKVM